MMIEMMELNLVIMGICDLLEVILGLGGVLVAWMGLCYVLLLYMLLIIEAFIHTISCTWSLSENQFWHSEVF